MFDSWVWAVFSVAFSGCALPLCKIVWKKVKAPKAIEELCEDNSEVEAEVEQPLEFSYKQKLGLRHQELRENVLGLTLAEMSKVYALDEVSLLEEYEFGAIELPKSYITIAMKYFSLRESYFDPELQLEFLFITISNRDYRTYLSDGYEPYIMCSPHDREFNLYAYMYFYREDNGIPRMVRSSLKARFKSGDSGKRNVESLIHYMKELGFDQDHATVIKVSADDWALMENSSFYKKMRGYEVDWECMDIFDSWYRAYRS